MTNRTLGAGTPVAPGGTLARLAATDSRLAATLAEARAVAVDRERERRQLDDVLRRMETRRNA